MIIVRASEFHARWVATHLREGDKQELRRAGREDFEQAVLQSVNVSVFSFAALHKGLPVCVFGLVPDGFMAHSARVWLLGTESLNFMKKSFVKKCRQMISQMLGMYPVLYNAVDANYPQALRLLRFLGAEFVEKVITKTGAPFLIFEIRRKDYVHGN